MSKGYLKMKFISFVLMMATAIFFAGMVAGQEPGPATYILKPSERHWWVHNLAATDFPDSIPDEWLPALQAYLNLTDAQIEEIKKLKVLYEKRARTAKGADHLQMLSDTSDGRIPRNLEKEKAVWKAFDSFNEQCVVETDNARQILGEKFDDLLLWSQEQTIIEGGILRGLQKSQTLNNGEIEAEAFETVKKTNEYKNILNREQKKSKGTWDRYSRKFEKDIKLRVLYRTTAMSGPWLPARERKEKGRQTKEKMFEILDEIKKNKQD